MWLVREELGDNTEEGYKKTVVTEKIPTRNYVEALSDEDWGEPVRVKWKTITEAKCFVKVNPQ